MFHSPSCKHLGTIHREALLFLAMHSPPSIPHRGIKRQREGNALPQDRKGFFFHFPVIRHCYSIFKSKLSLVSHLIIVSLLPQTKHLRMLASIHLLHELTLPRLSLSHPCVLTQGIYSTHITITVTKNFPDFWQEATRKEIWSLGRQFYTLCRKEILLKGV